MAYTASKHGLIGLTRNTAAYYRLKGIRCNAIAAGAMITNIGNVLASGDFNMDGMQLMKKACKIVNKSSFKTMANFLQSVIGKVLVSTWTKWPVWSLSSVQTTQNSSTEVSEGVSPGTVVRMQC